MTTEKMTIKMAAMAKEKANATTVTTVTTQAAAAAEQPATTTAKSTA